MAVDMFLQLGDIQGGAQDSRFEGAINVLAWAHGASDVEGKGTPVFQDLSLTKFQDVATVDIARLLYAGTRVDRARLSVRPAGDTRIVTFELELAGVRVTSLSQGGSGGEDRLTENMTLSYESIKMTHVDQADDGTARDLESVAYDLSKRRLL